MYLHDRNTEGDFASDIKKQITFSNIKFKGIVKENRKRFPTGVVHSFTGNLKELKDIMELDLYIGKIFNLVMIL